jgi:hypothetical protein
MLRLFGRTVVGGPVRRAATLSAAALAYWQASGHGTATATVASAGFTEGKEGLRTRGPSARPLHTRDVCVAAI